MKTVEISASDFACHNTLLDRTDKAISKLVYATQSLMEESQDHVKGRDILDCVEAIAEIGKEQESIRERKWFQVVSEKSE